LNFDILGNGRGNLPGPHLPGAHLPGSAGLCIASLIGSNDTAAQIGGCRAVRGTRRIELLAVTVIRTFFGAFENSQNIRRRALARLENPEPRECNAC
jgi:hypothetical protein